MADDEFRDPDKLTEDEMAALRKSSQDAMAAFRASLRARGQAKVEAEKKALPKPEPK